MKRVESGYFHANPQTIENLSSAKRRRDQWGRGVGSLITDYCFEMCGSWGIDRVYAETTADNQRMQSILPRHHVEAKKATAYEILYETSLGDERPVTQRPVEMTVA